MGDGISSVQPDPLPEPPTATVTHETVPRVKVRREGRRRRWLLILLALLLSPFAALGLGMTSHAVRWRVRLLWSRAGGDYKDIPMGAFVRWLRPGSDVDLSPLLDNRNVRAVIRNAFTSNASADAGMQIFAANCARCHGEQGRGGAGPSLLASIGHSSDWHYFSTVKWGRPGTMMLPQPLTDREIWTTLAYVRRMLREAQSSRNALARQLVVNVPAASIARSSEDSDAWLTYAGTSSGHRHSHLAQISKRTIGELRLAWTAQFRSDDHALQGSPIVTDKLLIVPGGVGEVAAFDARTGASVWEFGRPNPADLELCCGASNRGVAILGDTVFVTTLDAHLVALDAATGAHRWETMVADFNYGYSMNAAPLVIGDHVIVGVSGGDFGARGLLASFSPKDGSKQWQFDTVPRPGQPGHETWPGDTWKMGGAATWVTGAADEQLGLVYWGVGNAAPIYFAEARPGDNLYSMCAIAVEIATGKLRWYFQFTPGDDHDWDSANQPIVADIDWHGAKVPALLWANRNGFFYALDRRTGKFLYAKPFAKQTWATGFDPNGRPILNPGARPTAGGTLAWPWVGGATNWQPPSYDAQRGLVYVPTIDAAGLFYAGPTPKRRHGQMYRGGAARAADDQPATISVKAVAAATGDVRWEARLAQGLDVNLAMGGVLSTDGGVAFVGTGQDFFAIDADSGKEFWRINLGGTIRAAPVAYAVDGREHVAIIAGRTLYVFALPAPAPATASVP